MANMALAYTSSGVESVALIDQEALDSLATWLCDSREFHWYVDTARGRKVKDDAYEIEVKKNGGYCNICKHFAGQILSHFELVRKPSAE